MKDRIARGGFMLGVIIYMIGASLNDHKTNKRLDRLEKQQDATASELDMVDHTLRIEIENDTFRCSGECGQLFTGRHAKVWVSQGGQSYAALCTKCAPKQPHQQLKPTQETKP